MSTISGISYNNGYSSYQNTYSGQSRISGQDQTLVQSLAAGQDQATGQAQLSGKPILNSGESEETAPGRKSSPAECETCKNRKYQDGSDEMVSFKTAQHISPDASASAVRSHEQEHVSNAYTKAEQNNGKVVSCSVAIHTAVCPECGRTYISGGDTTTQIKYYNEENPYQQDMKSSDAANKYSGANIDLAV